MSKLSWIRPCHCACHLAHISPSYCARLLETTHLKPAITENINDGNTISSIQAKFLMQSPKPLKLFIAGSTIRGKTGNTVRSNPTEARSSRQYQRRKHQVQHTGHRHLLAPRHALTQTFQSYLLPGPTSEARRAVQFDSPSVFVCDFVQHAVSDLQSGAQVLSNSRRPPKLNFLSSTQPAEQL